MISSGSYRTYEKGRIVFLILAEEIPILVVKFYKSSDELLLNEFETQKTIYEKYATGISKPMEILQIEDRKIMIEEFIPGKSIARHFSDDPSKWSIQNIMKQTLDFYHNLNNNVEPSTLDKLENEVNLLVEQFIKLYAPDSKEIAFIQDLVSSFLQNFSSREIYRRFTNGDFIPKNLIINHDKVTMIDYEFAEITHLYFLDWFRFFNYQQFIPNDLVYDLVYFQTEDEFFKTSLREFSSYRINNKFDLSLRLLFEIKNCVMVMNVISHSLYSVEKKRVKKLLSEMYIRLRDLDPAITVKKFE